jgi:hypothetical protein
MVNPNPKAKPDLKHGNSHPLRAEAIEWIYNHLFVNGESDLRPIYERYEKGQGVGHHTVWGWIRQVKAAGPRKTDLSAAAARVEEIMDTDIGKNLPVAPSPHYVASAGERGMRNLDILGCLSQAKHDIDMLRKHAVKMVTDPDTGEQAEGIKNPLLFEKQIQRRLNLADSAMKAMSEVWNLRTMQNFYETVVDEIGKESPECQQRIMRRLAALNARTGMTLNARV